MVEIEEDVPVAEENGTTSPLEPTLGDSMMAEVVSADSMSSRSEERVFVRDRSLSWDLIIDEYMGGLGSDVDEGNSV